MVELVEDEKKAISKRRKVKKFNKKVWSGFTNWKGWNNVAVPPGAWPNY